MPTQSGTLAEMKLKRKHKMIFACLAGAILSAGMASSFIVWKLSRPASLRRKSNPANIPSPDRIARLKAAIPPEPAPPSLPPAIQSIERFVSETLVAGQPVVECDADGVQYSVMPGDSFLPERVRPVFDIASKLSFGRRLEAVHELPADLSPAERAALLAFLKCGEDDDNGFVLKNDILNKLREQQVHPEEYVQAMAYLLEDGLLDQVVRDYIVQHLRPCFEDNPSERPAVKKLLMKARSDRPGGTAAVALLALNSLARDFPSEIDARTVADAAAEIAADPAAPHMSRTSAIQVCAQNGIRESLPAIRELAGDEAVSTALRISAIAAMGRLGGTEDIATLDSIAASGDRRFAKALAAAKDNLLAGKP